MSCFSKFYLELQQWIKQTFRFFFLIDEENLHNINFLSRVPFQDTGLMTYNSSLLIFLQKESNKSFTAFSF